MAKAFFEVFPGLKLEGKRKDLFAQTQVERVTATRAKDFVRVYLESSRLILKEDVFAVEKEIKKDKPSRLHARRKMLSVLYGVTEVPTARAGRKKNTKRVDMPAKLFDEIAPKYVNRNGGYTRIVKIGQRQGDGAMEVLLELV